MDNAEEWLRTARRLWYSERNASRAQMMLNDILKEYPDSPEAESAKELRDLIAKSPAPREPFSEPRSDQEQGCGQAAFRVLAALLGIGSLVMVAHTVYTDGGIEFDRGLLSALVGGPSSFITHFSVGGLHGVHRTPLVDMTIRRWKRQGRRRYRFGSMSKRRCPKQRGHPWQQWSLLFLSG